MIDHVSIAVKDLAASTRFYETVLLHIGLEKLVSRDDSVGFGKRYPEFWLNARPKMISFPAGSGTHVCLRTRSKDSVDAFHASALKAGAMDDGPPGLRPEYHDNYYAAFVRDPDGNTIEVVTFLAPD